MHDLKKIILNKSSTMQQAIEVLNNESLRIVLVEDESQKLIGTITDGDIRRGLLNHLSMNTKVSEFMFTQPTFSNINDTRDQILLKMQELDLLQIPVLDENGKVVKLETLQSLHEKKRYENPVFLMAGGLGKRLRPLTNDIPKPMLNVGSQPILETILRQFIDAGFYNFFISTHYKAEILREYFGDGSNWNVSIKYVYEQEPLGTAGALGLLPKNISDLPFIVMNGDLLTKVDFHELLSFHSKHGGDATICVRDYEFQVPYGVIKAEGQIVKNIIEKPVHKFFINAGIYVLNSDIKNRISGQEFVDMPNFFSDMINENNKVCLFPLYEYWLDIGQINQFNQAQIDLKQLF
jgi:dTDP-glucose pyrophosphorylase